MNFEQWWDKIGSHISGVCKEDARHGWDAAHENIVLAQQTNNSDYATALQRYVDKFVGREFSVAMSQAVVFEAVRLNAAKAPHSA